jgi:hypothetical protein
MLEQLHSPEDENPAEAESPQLDPQGNLRSEVVRPKASLIHIKDDYHEESEEENYRSRRCYHRRLRHRDEPSSPLTLELEKVSWPARFNVVSLP